MSPPTSAADERRAVPSLRVGYVPGVTLTKWRRTWAERFSRLSLEVIEVAEPDQLIAVESEQVDMCFVRHSADSEGPAGDALHAIPLYEEVPVAVAPKDHPVSLFDEVTLADLSEEHLIEGFPPDQAVDLVAGGAGLLIVPQSVARTYSRRDVVHRPVPDAVPTRISLAWLRENPHEMIEEFIGIVRGRTVNSSRSPRSSTEPSAPTDKSRTGGGRKTGEGGRPPARPGKRPGRPRGY